MSKTTKFSKEDEALLDSYSNNVSAKGFVSFLLISFAIVYRFFIDNEMISRQAIFYLNALISTAAPVYLFLGINHMDVSFFMFNLDLSMHFPAKYA